MMADNLMNLKKIIIIIQTLDSGDEHPKTVGTSKRYVKLNRFANITVCKGL